MADSQTIYRSFVQIPVLTLCVLGLVGCPGSDDGCNPIIAGTMPYLCFLPSTTPDVPSSTMGPAEPNQPPTVPTNLIVNATSPNQIDLSWDASTDDDLWGYDIFRDGVRLKRWFRPSAIDSSVNPKETYCYSISAFDHHGLWSEHSEQVCATTPPDVTAPTVPRIKVLYDGTNMEGLTFHLTWGDSIDDVELSHYNIIRNGFNIATVTTNNYSDTGLNSDTEYCYEVTAVDMAGNKSPPRNPNCNMTSWKFIAELDGKVHSIGLDSLDNAYIAYYPIDFKYLKLATIQSGDSSSTTLDTNGKSPTHNLGSISLAIDNNDNIHIGYSARYGISSRNYLRYTTNSSGSWVFENILSSPLYGASFIYVSLVSLAVDATNKAHFYLLFPTGSTELLPGRLEYTSNTSGAWVFQDINEVARTISEIVIDSAGYVHISYVDLTDFKLMYATNSSGTWRTQIIDNDGHWTRPSISIGFTDSIHIAYYDSVNQVLKVANNASGSWAIQNVDDYGYGPSLASDSAGKQHVIYRGVGYAVRSSLKYATNKSGAWKTYTINHDSPTSLDIAIDNLDKIHISYARSNDRGIAYITNR